MPRCLKVSHLLIVNMMLFVIVSNVLKLNIHLPWQCSTLGYWGWYLYDLVCKGNILLSTLMDVSCAYILVCRRTIFFSVFMSSVICTDLWSICRPSCNIWLHLIPLIEYMHAKILESTLECQVSWGDTNDVVFDLKCNLGYASMISLCMWHWTP